MLWQRRADFEKDLIKHCKGRQLITRNELAEYFGWHPSGKRISSWLKPLKDRKIGGKYPIVDVSEVIWNSRG